MPQGYRNARTGYLTDLLVDTTPVGSIVPNLKAGRNSKDHFEKPDSTATYPKLVETSGNAYLNADDPAWTHDGYLYCDGSIHNIGDYVQLYEIVGNLYGGRSSSGIDIVAGGQNYTTSSTVTISAPPSGGTQATAVVGSVDANGAIVTINVTNAGSGYTSVPTVTVGTGTGATLQVRFDSTQGTILGISQANVMANYGDQYLGTFGVPDTKARKIVGNGPVYGANSPNAGNSTLGCGTTGGKWYVNQDAQDDYFSLGTIRTSGYENVVETTECSIIGSQTVTVTMRETKLSGPQQHTHLLLNSIPGSNQWIQEYSGDRYLVHYKPATGKLNGFYPSTGEVLTHNHGLLRQPIADPEVASYDVLDYLGGRGGVGSIQNPLDSSGNDVPYNDQKYMASGDSSAGTTQLQTSIPAPTHLRLTPSSLVGGRQITSGGTPVYDYSQVVVDTSSPGSGTANITVTGTPDLLIYNLCGGGGSGAAGTTGGNNGGESWLKIGPSGSEVININAAGGSGGSPSSGANGGGATFAAPATSSGTETITGVDGMIGTAGAGTIVYVADSPTNPGGGGTGGAGTSFVSGGTIYGGGTNGVRGKTNNSGTLSQTIGYTNPTGTFNISSVTADPSEVKFTLEGGSGAESSLDTYVGQNQAGGKGAWVQCFLNSSARSTFRQNTWSVKIGTASNDRNGGTGPLGSPQQGGYGGTGYNGAHGGGGGSSALLYRGSQIIAGAGGGGGAGADGYDGGDGESGGVNSGNAAGITGGSLRKVGGNTGLDAGFGGGGGNYGCRGGGGGGGGAGCAENGFSGFGGGGAGGDPGSGGHDGGDGGYQGPSAVRTLYFEDSTANSSSHTNQNASIKMEVTWDGSFWQAAGGGGGGGAFFTGNIPWSSLGNPSSLTYNVGSAGNGVTNGGQSTGNAGGGYCRVAIGTITGYTGGTTTTTTGDVISLASQTATSFDVDIFSGGAGTGTAGFKLPTTQVPIVVFTGGGLGAGATTHATATCTVSPTLHKVTSIALNTTAGTNSGYTEKPYVYVLGGAGTLQTCTANISTTNTSVTSLVYTSASAAKAERYLKFGGTVAATRWVETVEFDTTNANYFTIKACRGNGVNGGDIPEESLLCYYQKGGTTTWTLLDTIINPGSDRTDPLMGNVPSVANGMASNFDGASGDTQWHSYSVAIPEAGRGTGTKFKLEQIRTPSGSDNSSDSDHYGICEFSVYNQKVSSYVFVPDPGAVSRPLVDSLAYTVEGEGGAGFTYTSGLGCGDATLTLKSTTKIEPVATIDPDYDIPLVHPYHVCKYLIKAF